MCKPQSQKLLFRAHKIACTVIQVIFKKINDCFGFLRKVKWHVPVSRLLSGWLRDKYNWFDFLRKVKRQVPVSRLLSGWLRDKYNWFGFCGKLNDKSQLITREVQLVRLLFGWLRDKYNWFDFLRKVKRQVPVSRLLSGWLRDKYNWFGFCGKLNDKSQLITREVQLVRLSPESYTTSRSWSAFALRVTRQVQLVRLLRKVKRQVAVGRLLSGWSRTPCNI